MRRDVLFLMLGLLLTGCGSDQRYTGVGRFVFTPQEGSALVLPSRGYAIVSSEHADIEQGCYLNARGSRVVNTKRCQIRSRDGSVDVRSRFTSGAWTRRALGHQPGSEGCVDTRWEVLLSAAGSFEGALQREPRRGAVRYEFRAEHTTTACSGSGSSSWSDEGDDWGGGDDEGGWDDDDGWDADD